MEKKCLIASAGTHSVLCLVVIFGSAFFVSHDNTISPPPMRAFSAKLIDDALAGGGGNPKIAPTEDKQKGQTLIPQPPVAPQHVEQPQPRPAPPVPRPEVKPKPEIKRTEVKPTKPPKEAVKEPVKEPVKPRPDPVAKPVKPEPLVLKPITRPTKDAEKEQAAKEQAAKEKAAKEQADAEAREAAANQKRIAQALGKATDRLKQGFSKGTVLDISAIGGEDSADYTAFVRSVYEDAWVGTDDLTDETSTVKVSVTIARSGRVISASIRQRSGTADLDKSVQRALEKVRFVAPFPAGATDEQRTFLINFNLKAKRLLG